MPNIIDYNLFTCWYSIIWKRRSFHLPNSNFLYSVHNSQPPNCILNHSTPLRILVSLYLFCWSYAFWCHPTASTTFTSNIAIVLFYARYISPPLSLLLLPYSNYIEQCKLWRSSLRSFSPFLYSGFNLNQKKKNSNFCLLFKSHQTFCKVWTKFQTCFNISIKIMSFHFFLLNMCCMMSSCRR